MVDYSCQRGARVSRSGGVCTTLHMLGFASAVHEFGGGSGLWCTVHAPFCRPCLKLKWKQNNNNFDCKNNEIYFIKFLVKLTMQCGSHYDVERFLTIIPNSVYVGNNMLL